MDSAPENSQMFMHYNMDGQSSSSTLQGMQPVFPRYLLTNPERAHQQVRGQRSEAPMTTHLTHMMPRYPMGNPDAGQHHMGMPVSTHMSQQLSSGYITVTSNPKQESPPAPSTSGLQTPDLVESRDNVNEEADKKATKPEQKGGESTTDPPAAEAETNETEEAFMQRMVEAAMAAPVEVPPEADLDPEATEPRSRKPPVLDGTKAICRCKLFKKEPCYTRWDTAELQMMVDQNWGLSRKELDIALMAKISCGLHTEKTTRRSKQKNQNERKSSRCDYFQCGYKICRDMFKFIHGISTVKLTAIIKHYKLNGIKERIRKIPEKKTDKPPKPPKPQKPRAPRKRVKKPGTSPGKAKKTPGKSGPRPKSTATKKSVPKASQSKVPAPTVMNTVPPPMALANSYHHEGLNLMANNYHHNNGAMSNNFHPKAHVANSYHMGPYIPHMSL